MIKASVTFARARNSDQKQERREAILESARTLFVRDGFENVFLRDIADDARLAKSNIYRYFESREHIYLVIMQRAEFAWEKKTVSLLEKFQRKATIGQVAGTLAHTFAGAKTYCLLTTVTNSVLEQNLSQNLFCVSTKLLLNAEPGSQRQLQRLFPEPKESVRTWQLTSKKAAHFIATLLRGARVDSDD